jgi:chorismate mutase/prephenate dehydratase
VEPSSGSVVKSVAFLGPEATFSHEAAMALFGRSTQYRPADSIDGVFSLVKDDLCSQGVVPVENSYEGSVKDTLDLLCQYDLLITAEHVSRIRQHLLSRVSRIDRIEHLYSHPMAIAQCRQWIKTHMAGIRVSEVASTALAAKMASNDPAASAIGSRLAGRTYGLNILEQNIEDISDNFTRFLVIGRQNPKPSGRDKTSFLFRLKSGPDNLYKVLGVLALRGINLIRIESRPTKKRKWEYMFFIDVEGHEQEDRVSEAFREMEAHCLFLKWLGSYPYDPDL